MSKSRGAVCEEKENEEGIIDLPPAENLTTSTIVYTVPATTDQFVHTPEFRRYFIEFVRVQTLMALRLETKGWNAVADTLIDEGVRSGELIVHGGTDISQEGSISRIEKVKLVTRVVFLLNITKVGERCCRFAANLVVVEISEGVKSIDKISFYARSRLTAVSFPRTLTSIGRPAFSNRWSLDNVDLLHTNLQELGNSIFIGCSELKSLTIPGALQTLGHFVFAYCSKLVPSLAISSASSSPHLPLYRLGDNVLEDVRESTGLGA
ncbi:hypothetical protein TrLO_g13420 [Triparma laevis f. longispina]|uniref:Uncharacterized protein n=1 Tax=Triparma laevis f. longispina TaxID=1714387 RepID=A0A9W7FS60_9STRA|nr:hypothetical protein TrLO_g13420 [Triparma laevis f. longispina]